MRNTFLLEELIIEGRIEDVKKKYPRVGDEMIDHLSKNDPSGNNKYLDWMVGQRFFSNIPSDTIIEKVNLFHKNLNKLTKENLNEFVKSSSRFDWLLTDDSPIAKEFQKIYKSPKDINQYTDWVLFVEVVKFINELLTKSDVKKLETKTLYNDDNLLILIPLSHKASCFYGSGTKWCTTNKESDNYFKSYSSKGTLFYIINKKEPQSNPWYKAAIFFNNDGNAEAYDAPDKPTSIKVAKDSIPNWDTVRDVIVDYLSSNNKKGIDKLYFGDELITWIDSLGLDPLKTLSYDRFIKELGVDKAYEYMVKKQVDPIDYIEGADNIFYFYSQLIKDELKTVKTLWELAKKRNYNPFDFLDFSSSSVKSLLNAIIENIISLDDFLNEIMKHKYSINNLFGHLSNATTAEYIIKLFKTNNTDSNKEAVNLFFNFCFEADINPFNNLNQRVIKIILDVYSIEEKIDFILKNINLVPNDVELYKYGIDDGQIFAYCDDEEIKLILSKNLLSDINLDLYIKVFGNSPETYWRYISHITGLHIDIIKYRLINTRDFVETYLFVTGVRKIFPTLDDLQKSINDLVGLDEDGDNIVDVLYNVSTQVVVDDFFNKNYYEAYLNYKKLDILDDFDDLFKICAYNSAPPEDKEIKEEVLSIIEHSFGGYRNGQIREEGGSFYLTIDDLCYLEDLYTEVSGKIVCGEDIIDWYGYDADEAVPSVLEVKGVSELIRDYLMEEMRNKKITLKDYYIDDFESWVEDYDEDNGKFSITLYDERIVGMSNDNLLTLIMNGDELIKLKREISWSFNDAVNGLLSDKLYKKAKNSIEEIFGSKGEWQDVTMKYGNDNTMKEKNVFVIKLNYIVDDVIDYALEKVNRESNIPTATYVSLIEEMMEEGIGRFDGKVDLNVDYTVETFYPYTEDLKPVLIDILKDRIYGL